MPDFENALMAVIGEIAEGRRPTIAALDDLRIRARYLQQAETLLNRIVETPGTTLYISGLRLERGDVIIDDDGIFIKNSADAWFNFGDSSNTRGVINIAATPSNALEIVNLATGGIIAFFLKTTGDAVNRVLHIGEDASLNRVVFSFDNQDTKGVWARIAGNTDSLTGSKLTVGFNDNIDLRAEGTSSEATFMRMLETSRTPSNPGAGDAMHVYMKGDKFVIQFNDGGTIRYKYLDLTGTGVTWTHTTVAP